MFKALGNLSLLWAAGLACCACTLSAAQPLAEVRDTGKTLEAYVDGDLFFVYNYQDVTKPYLYPIYGADNLLMVRNYPMKKVEGEEDDHPHQKSLWFTHGDVNGVDYWTEGKNKGKIVHQNFSRTQSGETGVIESLNYWVKPDALTVQIKDQRKLEFSGNKDKRYLDFTIRLTAIGEDVTLGDTKEGTLGLRIAESMRLKGRLNKGHIANSDGLKDGAAWGKRACWVDYSGPVEGETVGVAILDHPSSFRYPTWWHVRDYGLFAANPFGVHEFEPKTAQGTPTPKTAGNYLLKKDEILTFKYRFIFHRGNEVEGQIAEEFQKFVK